MSDPARFVARVIEESENKIHSDDVARQFGFSGALVPGVELFARTTTPLVAAWGEQWLSSGRIDLRFRRPVYDGEQLRVALDGERLAVTGDDGDVRCVGSAAPSSCRPDVSGFADVPLGPAPAHDPVLGPCGSIHEPGTVEENDWYVEAIGEPLQLYRERSILHPGLLLRLVNRLLMRNVALRPWIHTSSDCTFLAEARLPAEMSVHGLVTALGKRGAHDEVRYDALVLAGDEPVLHVRHAALYRLNGE